MRAERKTAPATGRRPPAWNHFRPVLNHALLLLLLPLALAASRASAAKQAKGPPTDLTTMGLEDLMNIEVETVYGASKYLQKVTEAPASITIVTSDEIQKYGYRTLADILRSVRGYYITYDRNYSYVGVRGFSRPGDYNSRILLLVDGHRINDSIYDQAFLGTEFPVDVDLIDRVEVIRGPNSSLYTAAAFLGVVNIITKRGRNAKRLEVSGELASYGTYKTRVSYGKQLKNGLEMLLSGSFYDSHGPRRLYFKEFDSPITNNGIAENADDDQYQQLFANLSYRDFTLQAVYGSRDKGIPTASYGTAFNDPRTRTIDANSYVDLLYARNFGGAWGVTSHLYYDESYYDGTYVYDSPQPGATFRVVNKDYGHGKWWGEEVTLSKTFFERHKFSFGSEYRDNFRQDQGNFDENPFMQYFHDRRSSEVWAVYSQGEIAIRKGLILNVGLRYDHYSTFGGTTKPRAALIYSPLKRTTLKFLYGEAFRAPNFYELFYAGRGNKTNPLLRPENMQTHELVLEQYFRHHVRLAFSGFHYRLKGLISEQTDPADGLIVYRNVDRVTGKGLEMELEETWPGSLEGRFSYTLQDAENPITETRITNAPLHLGELDLGVPLFKKRFWVGTSLRYMSRRKTLFGDFAGAHVVPSFTLFSKSPSKGWEVSASIYNASGTRYGDPGGEEHVQHTILQDGRSWRVKVVRRF